MFKEISSQNNLCGHKDISFSSRECTKQVDPILAHDTTKFWPFNLSCTQNMIGSTILEFLNFTCQRCHRGAKKVAKGEENETQFLTNTIVSEIPENFR